MSGRRDAPSVDRALAVALRGVTSIESLGDAFPAGVLMTDAAGRCVYANPRVQELLGLNAEELARNGFVPAIEPDDRPTVERELAAAVADAADWQSEFRCRRRDGSSSPSRCARFRCEARKATSPDTSPRSRTSACAAGSMPS